MAIVCFLKNLIKIKNLRIFEKLKLKLKMYQNWNYSNIEIIVKLKL